MTIDGELSLEEAKRIAVQRDQAPVGMVARALDRLFVEVRRLENARDQHLFTAPAPEAPKAAGA